MHNHLNRNQIVYLIQAIKTRVALMPIDLVNKKETLEDLENVKRSIEHERKLRDAVKHVEDDNLCCNNNHSCNGYVFYGNTTNII